MSLKAKLDEMKAAFAGKVPAEAVAIMERDGAALAAQRAAAAIPGPGQPFPEFSLADSGGAVQTRASLAPGKPLVVSFFRGFW